MDTTALLEKRVALLEEILEVTRQQPALLAQEDINPLLDNIGRRQELIDSLEELTRALPEGFESAGGRHGELNRRARELYGQISAQDRQNETAAQSRMEEIKAQMRKLRDGKTAFGGYEKIIKDPGSTYFDKRQ
ncbi:MAG: flagellar protein FliT [Oscillospiraceae bacterium]|jgi:chromosome segregation ATPase|nr:flagellar protein FliT [Oscillospiraceae bacterium]